MPQLSWPERFAVDIRTTDGGDGVKYTVLTWLHRDKAAAIATNTFRLRYPDRIIYDVLVENLGLAPRREDGTVEIGHHLHDRYEF